MTSSYEGLQILAEIVGRSFEVAAIVAGGWWFLYTTQFKPRIQFDLECNFFQLPSVPKAYLVEVSFVFENKGFVEHRLYDLSLSIHGLSPKLISDPTSPDCRAFRATLYEKRVIVPTRYKWYFVRPGVRQVITHQVVLAEPGPVIQVTAGFSYKKRAEWPHTARRVFPLDPKAIWHKG